MIHNLIWDNLFGLLAGGLSGPGPQVRQDESFLWMGVLVALLNLLSVLAVASDLDWTYSISSFSEWKKVVIRCNVSRGETESFIGSKNHRRWIDDHFIIFHLRLWTKV